MLKQSCLTLVFAAVVAAMPFAQPQFSDSVRAFIKVDAPVVALTNVRVIDGTGAPARANQTVIIRNGNIESIGSTGRLPLPARATTLDLAGRSVIPGLVMVHEHLSYPAGPGVYGQLGESFVRLYLAGGVTSMRTGGNVNGFMDLKLKRLIDAGQKAGPSIDATAPYLNGPNTFSQMRELKGGGVVPGYANQRQLELLVEAGFSPLEAISIGTMNGAKYLGRDARVGTIAAGKQADLVVLNGDPSTNIADVRNVEIVFKQGVGFDSARLIESVRGKAGLW